MRFPIADPTRAWPHTCIELDRPDSGMPKVTWFGHSRGSPDMAEGPAVVGPGSGMPLLGEHAHARFTRPHLRGHRLGQHGAGLSWTTRFSTRSLEITDGRLRLLAFDEAAELEVILEIESLV